ncbi:helix-turn-helix domain-containing protein [Corynebacterium glutamicum]|uniref:helix-turn-helix domain-containing protein n=1 Tax=Corynebacterium glutamicum TaxID=1718 RepID=UPI001B8A9D37|nr:helix-turn-helix domain-containing protein [Corynebacterium glutamicum]
MRFGFSTLAQLCNSTKGRAKKLTDEDLQEIREKIAAGVPKAKLAREYNVNRTTLYRALERE